MRVYTLFDVYSVLAKLGRTEQAAVREFSCLQAWSPLNLISASAVDAVAVEDGRAIGLAWFPPCSASSSQKPTADLKQMFYTEACGHSRNGGKLSHITWTSRFAIHLEHVTSVSHQKIVKALQFTQQ